MRNQVERKVFKSVIFKNRNFGMQTKLRVGKIKRKYKRTSQVLGRCHLVEAKVEPMPIDVEHPTIPTTVKWMQKSYLSGGLPLPLVFCKAYLPMEVTIMVLETETGEQYKTNYLPLRYLLSGGWRRFARDKNLETGDAVVFQLVEATKFKVHLIRANASNNDEVKLPIHLPSPVNVVKQRGSSKIDSKHLIVYRKGDVHQIAENHKPKTPRLKSRYAGSSILFRDGIPFSNITSLEEFEDAIHKLLQNHELPYLVLHDYYELCCSQNAFLHAHLFKGINPRCKCQIIVLAIKRIISDTVSIANALSTCKLSTFLQKNKKWEQDLNAYEALGMNVSFLLARLYHLKSIALDGTADKSRFKEACHERGLAEDEARKLEVILDMLRELEAKSPKINSLVCVTAEIRNLESLLDELGKFFCEYDAHIETLKLKAKNHERTFQEQVSAPL